ncbi:MAG TPA: hypothetical protein VGX68_24850 [Thermoanaerobaculia bacterium]|jgi:cysteinyl-tRNA synthetase|nr:hypothetical protein [Thermoanaerobaculia bacterium]
MSKSLSVAEILAKMEARIAEHKERKAFHAQQETHHRERHAFHDAELEKVVQRYEALKAASEATAEYTVPQAPAEPEREETIPRFGDRPMVSRLVKRVVERQPEGEEFGAHAIAAEVNRRYADELDKPVKPSAVSTVLRRLARARKIHESRSGKAFYEALYVRGARPAKG